MDKALFDRDSKIGLTTFNLPQKVLNRLMSEANLEEINSQYEEEF